VYVYTIVKQMNEQFFFRPHSVEEVAVYIDATPKFIRHEIAEGRLIARRLSPRLIRILPGDLQRWLDEASTIVVTEAGDEYPPKG
jgi:hypothetical protein